jgi:sugar lactone lactonase YvrE
MSWTKSSLGWKILFCSLCFQLKGQVITTLAGTNSLGPPDGTTALQAAIGPNLVTADSQGNIYFIDQNTLVMKISVQGKVSRFAGNGIRGYSGDGGPSIDASLNGPSGIYADRTGNVFLADTANYRIRKIDLNGIITTIAGNGQNGVSPENTIAVNALIGESYSVAEDSLGNVYFADSANYRIAKVDTHGILTTVAGKVGSPGYSGDNGPATSAQLNYPLSVTVDPSNNIVIGDTFNYAVRVVNGSGIIKALAGTGKPGYAGDNGPAAYALIYRPWTVSSDSQGNILFVDYDNNVIRRIDTKGVITTVAGSGKVGLGTENVPATSSALYYPFSVSAEPGGSFLIADFSNNTVRRVSSGGTITTVAGNGFKTISPNGGAASSAILAYPSKVAVDQSGNVLVADWNNQLVERVTLSNGTMSAISGIGRAAYTGDNVPAITAGLNFPQGVTTDRSGNIYISDTYNHRIRKIDSTGTITTIAGVGQSAYLGDNGPALKAYLSVPQGLRFDPSGNLVFADSNNNVIRSISPQGVITTIAGTGTAGYNRDGIPATQAQLNLPPMSPLMLPEIFTSQTQ